MSSTSASIFPCKIQMESSCKFQPAITRFTHFLVISKHMAKRHRIIRNQNLQLLGTSIWLKNTERDNDMVVCCSAGPGSLVPSSPSPGHGSWKLWVLGILLSVVLPFWRSKWAPLLKLKAEAETVIDKVEAVTNTVEKVLEQVEEVADEIGNILPEGRLKDTLEIEENVEEVEENVKSWMELNSTDERKKIKEEDEE
ncbi:Detected protein of unknown function [Hibiscus syriacus]|uniref:Uncharacterized protein n=1 Tax=Hibiscus syriacus TaxID=106335 RepID=A0A6A3C8Y5_HIBSY|nr:Detected protein of unknown function [Hibiscus syriacus]